MPLGNQTSTSQTSEDTGIMWVPNLRLQFIRIWRSLLICILISTLSDCHAGSFRYCEKCHAKLFANGFHYWRDLGTVIRPRRRDLSWSSVGMARTLSLFWDSMFFWRRFGVMRLKRQIQNPSHTSRCLIPTPLITADDTSEGHFWGGTLGIFSIDDRGQVKRSFILSRT